MFPLKMQWSLLYNCKDVIHDYKYRAARFPSLHWSQLENMVGIGIQIGCLRKDIESIRPLSAAIVLADKGNLQGYNVGSLHVYT